LNGSNLDHHRPVPLEMKSSSNSRTIKEECTHDETTKENNDFSVSASIGDAIHVLEGIEMRVPMNIDQSSAQRDDMTNINITNISDENYRVPNIPSSTSLPSLATLVNESEPAPSASLLQQSQPAFRRRRSIPKTEGSDYHHVGHQHPTSHSPHHSPLHSQKGKHVSVNSSASSNPSYIPDGVGNVALDHNNNPNQVVAAESVLGIRIRDLRRLDFNANANEDISVQVRRHVVLFSADPIRAVITATKLWIVVPPGADSLMKNVDDCLQEWWEGPVKQSKSSNHVKKNVNSVNSANNKNNNNSGMDTPVTDTSEDHMNIDRGHLDLYFEGHCYETLLSTVTSIIESESSSLIKRGQKVLKLLRLKNIILTTEAQASISSLKVSLSQLIVKVQKYRISLEDILNDEETTALMNLTYLLKDPSLYMYPIPDEILIHHEEVEQSLEGYLTDLVSIESNLEVVASQLVGFEFQAAVRLDTSGNQLLTANIVLMVFICFSVFGAYIAGMFAMNLNNSQELQPIPGIFAIIACGTTVFIFVGTYCVYKLLVVFEYVIEDDPVNEKLIKTIPYI